MTISGRERFGTYLELLVAHLLSFIIVIEHKKKVIYSIFVFLGLIRNFVYNTHTGPIWSDQLQSKGLGLASREKEREMNLECECRGLVNGESGDT